MKRTQRNLFIIMAAMVAFYSIVTRLPWQAALTVAGAVLIAMAIMAVWGRDYFIGRRQARRREWSKAVDSYERFERKLLKAPWRRAAVVLYLGIYSFDGVAITRNHIAQAWLSAGELDKAVAWLRSALLRDPQYAVPYVNLAIIAAMKHDEALARREMSKAVFLGFNPQNAQRILRRALETHENDGGR